MGSSTTRAERGQMARSRILAAAQQRFAAEGFKRATVRAIAADAHIDASMVIRYFTSKEGLYAAATDIDLGLPVLGASGRGGLGLALAQHSVNRWQDARTGAPLRVMLASALSDPTAAARINRVFASQISPVIAAAGLADDASAATRAGLIASQVLGFALTRYVLRIPPLVELSDAAAVQWLGPVLQHYLDVDEPDRAACEPSGPPSSVPDPPAGLDAER